MFVGVFIFSNICKYLNEWRSAISIYIYRGERDALIAREEFIEQISHWGEEKDVPAPRKYFILKILKLFFFRTEFRHLLHWSLYWGPTQICDYKFKIQIKHATRIKRFGPHPRALWLLITIWPNKNNFFAFSLKYFFVGLCVLTEKV